MEASGFDLYRPDYQTLNGSARAQLRAVGGGALFISGKEASCSLFVSVHLPAAGQFARRCIFYKASDIFRGITEKKSYFMGEIVTFLQSFCKSAHAFIVAGHVVSARVEDLGGRSVP